MEIIFLVILFIVICYVSYLFVSIFAQEEKRNHEVLKRQAEKRRGKTQKSLLMPPILEFSDKGRNISVFSAYKESEGSSSLMKCSLKQCRAYNCTILEQSSLPFPSMSKYPPKIHLKEPISSRFIIYSNDKDMTEQFVNTKVREVFENLYALKKFEIKNGFFVLKIAEAITDDQTADRFIEAGLTMIQRLIDLHTTK